MADEESVQNSEEFQDQPAKKKGGLKRLLMICLLLAVVAATGAGGFFYWRQRAAIKARAALAAKDHQPEHGHSSEHSDDTEVKEVVELLPFIVNLADRNETRYLRMTVSLGVGESREGKADPVYTTRVRNAILAIITTKTSEQVLTVEGKAELRKEMLNAARTAVDQPEVHAIYITDFIVQM